MNEVLSESKHKNKSTYTTWVTYFTHGTGARSEIVLEAMLTYWLSWYVLPNGPEDGINLYVFSVAIRRPKERNSLWRLFFLVRSFFFFRLDECV